MLAERDTLAIPTRYFTLGSPLAVICEGEPEMKDQIARCLALPQLEKWSDFYSDEGFLCARAPVDAGTPKFEAHKLTITSRFSERLNGKSHAKYFQEDDILAALIA